MHSLSDSTDSLFLSPERREQSDDFDTEESDYSLYCRLTLGLRNADSWDCINVYGEVLPIFNAELTRRVSSSKFKRISSLFCQMSLL